MLTPLILIDEEFNILEDTSEDSLSPSKTYKFDIETGEIFAEFIDDGEALLQFIVKAIKTFRDKYLVYSEDYGSEIDYLLGQAYSDEYLELEVPRLIDEALLIDDRIESTENFVVSRLGDELDISFNVISTLGNYLVVEVRI